MTNLDWSALLLGSATILLTISIVAFSIWISRK